jgi:outer membrane protein TolC
MRSKVFAFALVVLAASEPVFAQSADSLTLAEAARLGAEQSAPALIARLRAAEAIARVTQRRADLLPNFNATAHQTGFTLNTATFGLDFPTPAGQKPFLDPNGEVIGPVNLLDLRGHVTLAAFDPAAFARLNAAKLAAKASDAEAASAAETGAANAAAAYLRAARAVAIVNARAADSILGDSLLNIARDQLKAGVGVALDVTRALSQNASNRAQMIAAIGERERTRLELLRAIGSPLDRRISIVPLTSMVTTDAIPSDAAAITTALQQRADIAALKQQADVGKLLIRAIKAERLPSISAFADDGAIGKTPSRLLNTYNWGVQLTLPIFDGYRRSGRIEEQRAVNSQADVKLRDLERQISVEVSSALVARRTARNQLEAANERFQLAEQEYKQARERFQAGVAGNADVITAALLLNASRNLVIDALAADQAARIELARAQGTVSELQ